MSSAPLPPWRLEVKYASPFWSIRKLNSSLVEFTHAPKFAKWSVQLTPFCVVLKTSKPPSQMPIRWKNSHSGWYIRRHHSAHGVIIDPIFSGTVQVFSPIFTWIEIKSTESSGWLDAKIKRISIFWQRRKSIHVFVSCKMETHSGSDHDPLRNMWKVDIHSFRSQTPLMTFLLFWWKQLQTHLWKRK